MLALGRLLRLSLAPSAAADIAAGVVLGARAWPGGVQPFLLILASLCVYHGGMALNDWADRTRDERTRPGRPIPSGALRPATVLGLAGGLLALGPLLAWIAAPRSGLCLTAVAVLAIAYDLGRRGSWMGPLLLGACRAGNLGSGIALGVSDARLRPELVIVPLLYGLYVFQVSRVARLEDADPADIARAGSLPGRSILRAALALVAFGLVPIAVAPVAPVEWSTGSTLPAWAAPACALALVILGAWGLVHLAFRHRTWTSPDLLRAVGMGLRRLLVATAAIAAGTGVVDGLVVAALILAGYPLSFALRRAFPPS